MKADRQLPPRTVNECGFKGGVLRPGDGETQEVDVRVSGLISLGVAPSCHGSLGRDLVPGLPDGFGEAVGEALVAGLQYPGVLTVDRAAYDEVDSSSWIFGTAAGLLAVVLGFEDLASAEEAVRKNLKEWLWL